MNSHHSSRTRRKRIGLIVAALAVLCTPALLFAHARLVRSTPAASAKLTSAPTSLGLWFSERPELRFTSIQLLDSAGTAVSLGGVAIADSMGVTVPITGRVAAGRYTVAWRTAAADGHATTGKYTFVVDIPAAPVASAAPVVASPPAVVQVPAAGGQRPKPTSNALIQPDEKTTFSTGMRWAELVSLLTMIGMVIFRLAVIPAAKWPAEIAAEASDRAVRLARAVVVLFIVATLTRAFAQTELMPNAGDARFAALMTLVRETRWGFGWAVGAVGAALALVGLVVAGSSLAGWIAAAVGAVAVCVGESLTGHAGASQHFAAAIAADVAHVLGAGGWLGGLTAIVLCGLPSLKRLDDAARADAGSRLLKAYHGTAVECVTIVVASAAVAVWIRLPTLSALWTTPYGQMLLRKDIFVVILLIFGFYHWRRIVMPAWTDDTKFRFQRTAAAELVIGAVVVAITAFLVSTPLPT